MKRNRGGKESGQAAKKRAESRYQTEEGKCQLIQSTNAQIYYDVTGTLEPSEEIERGKVVRDGTLFVQAPLDLHSTQPTQKCTLSSKTLLDVVRELLRGKYQYFSLAFRDTDISQTIIDIALISTCKFTE